MSLYRRTGSKVWWIYICHQGKRIRRSTGTEDKKLAEKIQAKVKTQLVEGKWFDFDSDEGKERTLKELAEKYLKERSARKSPSTAIRETGIFGNLVGFFGACPLSDITARRVNEYKNSRLGQVDGQTVKKELGVLRNAFNIAVREWEWVKDNPVSRISMPKDPPGRLRFLTQDEINKLIECSDKWFRPVFIVAIHTGLRLGNITSMTWDMVDLFKRRILLTAEDMKNKEGLSMPINGTAHEVFKELYKVKQLNSKLVFLRDGKPLYEVILRRALIRACGKVGITNLRFHDLRHTFASLLIQAGADLYTVQKLLGHKDLRMTQRYAHLTQEKLACAVGLLDSLRHKSATVESVEKETCL